MLGGGVEGNGAFHRETVRGMETSASRLSRVQAGDFIYSCLFAWRGAFDLIGPDLHGCFVSNEFPLFQVDETRIDARVTLSRCIGRQDQATDRSLRRHRGRCRSSVNFVGDAERLVGRSAPSPGVDQELSWRCALPCSRSGICLGRCESYPNVGVLSFARGLFTKPPIDGSVTSAASLYRIRTGQFLYSRLFAFEGAYAIVHPEQDQMFVSNEFPTFDIDLGAGLARIPLRILPISRRVGSHCAREQGGLGDRRQRVQPAQLLNH